MENGTILKERYKILRHIGSGGMAEVYLAEDLLLSRQVAIKVLRAQFNDDKTLLNQFKHEAQSAARLSSPSIINIFDVCEENGKSFIVMEYVEGKTLKNLLEEKGRLTPYQAVKIACEIAAGLSPLRYQAAQHFDNRKHDAEDCRFRHCQNDQQHDDGVYQFRHRFGALPFAGTGGRQADNGAE